MEQTISPIKPKQARVEKIEQSVSRQLALDLEKYILKFTKPSFAIRTLSKKTKLNVKTIKRLISCQNRPTYQTVFKLYSVFLNENKYSELLARCPPEITNYLEKYTPSKSVSSAQENSAFLDLITNEPLLAELYVLAGAGPLHKNKVLSNYGKNGLVLLKKLEERGIIRPLDETTYVATGSGPNLDGPALKYLGEYFVRKFLKPHNTDELEKNIISFYAEGLNESGKNAWLALDSTVFYKKLKIANDPKYKGDIQLFTFTATDTIKLEDDYV